MGLEKAGMVTQQEAIDAIRMIALPSAVQGILAGMGDEDAVYEATALLYGATEFSRSHPLVMIFAITQGMSEAEVDDFWRLCFNL